MRPRRARLRSGAGVQPRPKAKEADGDQGEVFLPNLGRRQLCSCVTVTGCDRVDGTSLVHAGCNKIIGENMSVEDIVAQLLEC